MPFLLRTPVFALALLCGPLLACTLHAQGPAVRWRFHPDAAATPTSSTGARGKLEGQYAYGEGPDGAALRFDGYTTDLLLPAATIPDPTHGFTLEATVALNTYPWNHLPLIDAEKAWETGYCLEIDAFGHLLLGASLNGQWQTVRSTEAVPLKRWAHITATYTTQAGQGTLALYLNGRLVASAHTVGTLSPAATDVLVGRVREPELPFPEAEVKPPQALTFSLDGLLGEVSFAPQAEDADQIATDVADAHLPAAPALPYTPMPSGPAQPGPFGAFYTGLRYEPAWDALRRLDNNSDIVVRFDDSPNRLVFWQGLNYVPAWVSGDDKWYTDEFLEVWNAGCPDHGDCEPMSDKQARFNRVNIVESNDVRAVVHWRYALAEAVGQKGAWPNPRTGWFDWADEYWTVYPDGVAIRKQVLHSDQPTAVHEWQETIVLHQPGMRPEDDIADDAVTLGNMAGATQTFRWTHKTDASFRNPDGPSGMAPLAAPNLQIVNTKSTFKPFQIVPPEGATADFYNNEKSFFTFECWNHWPVAQIASSDRPCVTTDRPSHSSVSHLFWQPYAQTANTATKILMDGLTSASMAQLLPLARSWISPPALTLEGNAVQTIPYDPTQRAYVLGGTEIDATRQLRLILNASASSPAIHPALVLEAWGEDPVQVSVEGHVLLPGKALRIAHERRFDRTDLLLWLPQQATHPLHLILRRMP